MNPNESCNEMYSRLNVLVKEINGLNIHKIKGGDVNRKILMLLPKPKYNIINAMLQKEDLDSMEVSELLGEIGAHEMSILGMVEGEPSSKNIAFKAKTQGKSKQKQIKAESSSCDEDEEEEETSEEDEGELALLMRKFTRLNNKINKRGYNYDPKKKAFRPRVDDKTRVCYNCGEKGHISPNCPMPDKRKIKGKPKHRQASSDEEEEKPRRKTFGKKKSYNDKKKLFPKKKGDGYKRSFMVEKQEWVTDVSSSEDSSDDEIAAIAITKDNLPPPPMCLMAKGNTKVCDEESGDDSDSDEELDPNAFANLIHEYASMIKKEKAKFKVLEEVHAKVKSSHSSLENKYAALLKEHDKSVQLVKQLEVENKDLTHKHNSTTSIKN